MVNMKDEDYFNSLSRRELQDLCRNNGLPANKTKPHLASLLASCYQKKNARSAASEERPISLKDGWPLTTPVLNSEPRPELNPTGGTVTGVHGTRVEASDMDNMRSSTCSKPIPVSTVNVVHRDPAINDTVEVYNCSNFEIQETAGCSLLGTQSDDVAPKLINKDTQESVEAREYDQNLMELDRRTGSRNITKIPSRIMNLGDIPTTAANANLLPTFEFYVSSEEGINIVVDLNSRPSDWIKKLNDGVCIHPEVLNNKSRALHHELKSSKGGDEETNASPLDNKVLDIKNKGDPAFKSSSSVSTVRDGNHVKDDHPDRVDRSSRSMAITQTNPPGETLGPVNDSDQMNSSLTEPNFDIDNPTNMSTKSSPKSSEKVTLASEVPLISQIISIGTHVTGSKSDGLKSFDSWDHQSKSGSTRPEIRKTGSLETSSVLLETIEPFTGTRGNGSGPLHGFSTSVDSMEMHLSEVASHSEDMSNSPYQNGGAPDPDNLMDRLQNEIGSSANSELDLNKSLDPLSEYPEELQRSNLTNEAESSECSDSDMEAKIYKRSNSSDSEGLQNKRQHRHTEDSNNPAIRNLTNAKDLGREVLPRRSKRLVSKFEVQTMTIHLNSKLMELMYSKQ